LLLLVKAAVPPFSRHFSFEKDKDDSNQNKTIVPLSKSLVDGN
jgi:hypothetical protein